MKLIFRVTLVLFFLATITSYLTAQEKSPARWSATLSQSSPSVGAEVDLILTTQLAPGWIVYSSDFRAEIGPQPTRLALVPSDAYQAVGPLVSIQPKRKTDRTWDIELGYFAQRAEFRQRVRILRKDATVEGRLQGQLCSETDGTCSLFDERISVTAK